jgi:ATP-dependent DNA helicase 2 subunit 2
MGKNMLLIVESSDPFQSYPAEYMPIEKTYSPTVHRINQGIRRRATHPNEPVEPPADILTKYSRPPPGLITKAAPDLAALIKAADVKKGKC